MTPRNVGLILIMMTILGDDHDGEHHHDDEHHHDHEAEDHDGDDGRQ